jgi:dTDP-4-dehydrorhamnose reductase
VESVLTPWDPEIVFNAAAYNQVDVAESEPQAAFLVNALAVRNPDRPAWVRRPE